MTVSDWNRIASDIPAEYHNFDGFVIFHGTDTMAYTASALSFMLENLGKTSHHYRLTNSFIRSSK